MGGDTGTQSHCLYFARASETYTTYYWYIISFIPFSRGLVYFLVKGLLE
jgi:hypothetical protein